MSTALLKIGARTLLILGVFALVALLYNVGNTRVIGSTFAVENVNLTIDSTASYNGNAVPAATWGLKDLVPGVDKFFNFGDIKPGDFGENTISLHVDKNAWVCLQFSNLTENENGVNEPEGLEDNNVNAELAGGTDFFAWRDDGDNMFEPQSGEEPLFNPAVQPASVALDADVYAIADALTLPVLAAGETRHVGIAWCAGNMAVNLATGAVSCDGTALGNAAQTDSFSVDISLGTVNADDDPSFTCSGEPPPPPPPVDEIGLGEQIGLYVKCELLANFGWPLPDYSTECPDGFGSSSSSVSTTQTVTQPSTIAEPPTRQRTRSR